MSHRAGFVSIIGKPNVGKSTLMNQLVGERLSIITSKAQTTRHRIMGILNGDNFQIVYSDTPGILNPAIPVAQIDDEVCQQLLWRTLTLFCLLQICTKSMSKMA
jgi:small GTP-binding protein